MADPFRKVRPGEPLEIPARAWNFALAAAQAYQRTKLGTGGGDPLEFEVTPRATFLVLNDTGADLPGFSVLAYGDPVGPDVAADTFTAAARPALAGTAPTDPAAPFAVTARPIPAGGLDVAVSAGLVPVQIDVLSETHTRAVPVAGITDHLASAAAGGVPIVWKEPAGSGSGSGSGSALRWAVILLGDPACCTGPPVPAAGATLPLFCPTGSGGGTTPPPDWDCVVLYVVCDPATGLYPDAAAYVTTCAGDPHDCAAVAALPFVSGAAYTRLISDLAAADAATSTVYCCPAGNDCLAGVEFPNALCVVAGNGTRALAGIGSAGEISTNTGAGWPVNLSAGGVTVSGVVKPCPTKCGLYFSGTITSTNPDPDNSPLYDCGCATTIGACAPDGADATQAVISSDWAVPTQTLRITTACGVVDLTIGKCPTYNCDPATSTCTDPGDGTGTYHGASALADCLERCGGQWYCVRITSAVHAGPGSGHLTCSAVGDVTCLQVADPGSFTGFTVTFGTPGQPDYEECDYGAAIVAGPYPDAASCAPACTTTPPAPDYACIQVLSYHDVQGACPAIGAVLCTDISTAGPFIPCGDGNSYAWSLLADHGADSTCGGGC